MAAPHGCDGACSRAPSGQGTVARSWLENWTSAWPFRPRGTWYPADLHRAPSFPPAHLGGLAVQRSGALDTSLGTSEDDSPDVILAGVARDAMLEIDWSRVEFQRVVSRRAASTRSVCGRAPAALVAARGPAMGQGSWLVSAACERPQSADGPSMWLSSPHRLLRRWPSGYDGPSRDYERDHNLA